MQRLGIFPLCQNIRHEYFKYFQIRNDKQFFQPWVIHQTEVNIYTSLPSTDILGSTWENLTSRTASGWSLIFDTILLPDLKPRPWFYLLSCRSGHPVLVHPAPFMPQVLLLLYKFFILDSSLIQIALTSISLAMAYIVFFLILPSNSRQILALSLSASFFALLIRWSVPWHLDLAYMVLISMSLKLPWKYLICTFVKTLGLWLFNCINIKESKSCSKETAVYNVSKLFISSISSISKAWNGFPPRNSNEWEQHRFHLLNLDLVSYASTLEKQRPNFTFINI